MMMQCRDYVFQLTSGQLDEASAGTRLEARVHRWICVRCRAFTHNDAVLTQVLASRRERLTGTPLASPDGGPQAPSSSS